MGANYALVDSTVQKPKLRELSDLFENKLEEYERLSGDIYNRLSSIILFAKPQVDEKRNTETLITYVNQMYEKLNRFDNINKRLAEISEGLKELVGE